MPVIFRFFKEHQFVLRIQPHTTPSYRWQAVPVGHDRPLHSPTSRMDIQSSARYYRQVTKDAAVQEPSPTTTHVLRPDIIPSIHAPFPALENESPIVIVSISSTFRCRPTGLRKDDKHNIGQTSISRATPKLPLCRVHHDVSSRPSTRAQSVSKRR
jgi:hypothetical protein